MHRTRTMRLLYRILQRSGIPKIAVNHYFFESIPEFSLHMNHQELFFFYCVSGGYDRAGLRTGLAPRHVNLPRLPHKTGQKYHAMISLPIPDISLQSQQTP